MEFDPLTGKLFSGSEGEFVVSTFDEKKIERNPYKGKILCCSWTPDGQFLAFGTFAGKVSIRSKDMEEIVTIF
jgi:intraflagellar transport protein 122